MPDNVLGFWIFNIHVGASTSNAFGKYDGPVHISHFYCSGSESDLLSCTYYTYGCSYSYHAGVKCEGKLRICFILCTTNQIIIIRTLH